MTTSDSTGTTAAVTAAVGRCTARFGHWTPDRWAARAIGADGPARTRGDVIHALVQDLADLAADAEGQPRRTVPRLDLALSDQLRVVAADLQSVDPPPTAALAAAVARITEALHAL